MGRLVLALLVVVMLSMTSYLAYATFGQTDQPAASPSAAATTDCPHATPSCCSEAATATVADDTPACCKEKANCCQAKGEAGACCQNPSKAQAIVADTKTEKKEDSPKKD